VLLSRDFLNLESTLFVRLDGDPFVAWISPSLYRPEKKFAKLCRSPSEKTVRPATTVWVEGQLTT